MRFIVVLLHDEATPRAVPSIPVSTLYSPMRKPLILAAAIALVGCGNRVEMPYYGKYEGGYVVDSTQNRLIPVAKRWNLSGYVQLLANRHKFKMHLEGEQQFMDISGTWKLDGKMVRLDLLDYKFEDYGGAANRNPNRTFTSADAIRTSFGKLVTLGIQPAERVVLKGPLLVIGESAGHLEFRKDPKGN